MQYTHIIFLFTVYCMMLSVCKSTVIPLYVYCTYNIPFHCMYVLYIIPQYIIPLYVCCILFHCILFHCIYIIPLYIISLYIYYSTVYYSTVRICIIPLYVIPLCISPLYVILSLCKLLLLCLNCSLLSRDCQVIETYIP